MAIHFFNTSLILFQIISYALFIDKCNPNSNIINVFNQRYEAYINWTRMCIHFKT